ncbi:MAG: DNA internalization-related competence protein ComEC/Rec2, partial [Pseudomonadales bacterium]
ALNQDQRWLLTATGTSHLMVISGLHIGLCALLGWWLGIALCHIAYWPLRQGWRMPVASLFSVILAAFYAALAGFSLPTQRALIMLLVVTLARLTWRNTARGYSLLLAALIILSLDPLAALTGSFWLSFAAVAAMLYLISSGLSWWRQMLWAQVAVTIGLLPVLAWSNLPLSPLAPLANLVAIPWLGWIVVPLLFAGLVITPLSATAGASVLLWGANMLSYLWTWLVWLEATVSLSPWRLNGHVVAILISVVGLAILLRATQTRRRWLALVLLLPLFIQAPLPISDQLRVTFLDVGQGQAVVVQTPNHVMLYDAGPSFDSGYDMGEAVVVPFLRYVGVNQLDAMVISHADIDHAGGSKAVLSHFPVGLAYAPVQRLPEASWQLCRAGMRWQWDGVEFEFLSPDLTVESKRNNRSCVLAIKTADTQFLLSGDIERKVERRLLATHADALRSNILQVPHHGSKTSSSELFVRTVKAEYAVVSAGFNNRFGHPVAEVVERYQRQDTLLIDTAYAGAIQIRLDKDGKLIPPTVLRVEQPRFWREYPCRYAELAQTEISGLVHRIYCPAISATVAEP